MVPFLSISDVERAVRARVLFGHQSVGENILDGVRDLIGTRVLSWTDFRIGRNEWPLSKIDAFRQLVDDMGGRASLAFFKFCYVDFHAEMDVERVFEEYKVTMARLARERPETRFAHVTVPLTAVGSGLKSRVLRRLGMPVFGEGDNAARHAFNERLRREYANAPLFDLARFEAGACADSTHRARDGARIPRLLSAYTDDGSHLNGDGRRLMAIELLRFVAAYVPNANANDKHQRGVPDADERCHHHS